jgi:hypothetical protein
MATRAQIAEWLAAKVKNATAPIEIEIAHQRGGRIDCVTFAVNETNEEFTDRIYRLAAEDAEGHGTGPQNYWLLMRMVGGTEAIARKPIMVDPEVDGQKGSEDADEYGLTHQAMRHEETNLRTFMRGFEYLTNSLARQIEGLQNLETERQRNELERMALQRKLNEQIANQRVEEQRLINAGRRDMWLMKQAELMLPIGVAKLFGDDGKTVFPHEAKILLTLVGKLRPEQMEKLLNVFDDAGRALLQELASGQFHPGFIGLAIQRLMSSLTEDQYVTILALLERGEQRDLFNQLFEARKRGLDWAQNEPKAFDRPKNGLHYELSEGASSELSSETATAAAAPNGKAEGTSS